MEFAHLSFFSSNTFKTFEQTFIELCQMFAELCSVSGRIQPLVSKEEATKLESEVGMNGEKVGELKKAAEKRLETQVGASEEVSHSHDQRRSIHSAQEPGACPSKDKVTPDESKNQGGVKHSMSLTIELMKKHSSLEGQMGLFDDLLRSRDDELIKREAEKLQQL